MFFPEFLGSTDATMIVNCRDWGKFTSWKAFHKVRNNIVPFSLPEWAEEALESGPDSPRYWEAEEELKKAAVEIDGVCYCLVEYIGSWWLVREDSFPYLQYMIHMGKFDKQQQCSTFA